MLALGRRALASDEAELLLAREAAALAQVADEFPDITIAMENARPYRHHSPYCYAESLDTLKKQVLIIDRANVAVNLDLGHLAMSASFYGFDPIVEVRSVAGLIRHTHVHDNFGGSVFCTERSRPIKYHSAAATAICRRMGLNSVRRHTGCFCC
jgi:sugar phosphate isomerase/epimerase